MCSKGKFSRSEKISKIQVYAAIFQSSENNDLFRSAKSIFAEFFKIPSYGFFKTATVR